MEELRRRKVNPLSVGRSIVATWEPNEKIVLEALRDATYRRGWIETRDALQLIGLRRAHSFCSELDDVERVRSLSPGTWCRVPGTRYLMRFPL